jgi:hypothetical protein
MLPKVRMAFNLWGVIFAGVVPAALKIRIDR